LRFFSCCARSFWKLHDERRVVLGQVEDLPHPAVVDGITHGVPVDHVGEVLVPDVACSRDAEMPPKAEAQVGDEVMPLLGGLPTHADDVMGLV